MIGLGIVLAFVLTVALLRGGGALALLDAHALMIVLGGSLAAAAVAYTPQALLRLPRLCLLLSPKRPLRCRPPRRSGSMSTPLST